MKAQLSLDLAGELIIDNFAGGGGASTGIELALGRSPDVAINHCRSALAMHQANHPLTLHLCESVWDVDIAQTIGPRRVGLLWLSPDCKHFSKAKGGKPRSKKIRGLAWVALRWVHAHRRIHGTGPRVIILENVEEFQTWGPVDAEGIMQPSNSGKTFRSFVGSLRRRGYVVEWRELRACDYGAPTIRKRLFLIARNDGKSIQWPEQTHGEGLKAQHSAAECIDWSIPAPSIFDRKRPLADNTCRRIAKGIMRYVVNNPKPYVVNGMAPVMTECANASAPRCMPADEPLRTICAETKGGHHALVVAFLIRYFGTSNAAAVDQPMPTIMPEGLGKSGLVCAFMVKYYGNEQDGVACTEPLHTIPTRDRFGLVLVKVDGETYRIVDIGLRMLTPRELFLAQGFPKDYIIDWGFFNDEQGNLVRGFLSGVEKVRMVGNSVSPVLACALVRANCADLAIHERRVA